MYADFGPLFGIKIIFFFFLKLNVFQVLRKSHFIFCPCKKIVFIHKTT